MRNSAIAVACVCVCLTRVPDVDGQGFGVYEQGACMMSLGTAGVAEPCRDGSAVYVNPAAMTSEENTVASGGVTLFFGSSSFRSNTGSATDAVTGTQWAPHVYIVHRLGEHMAVGAALYSPYGLGTEWPLAFGGRFLSFDSKLETVYVQPSLAYAFTVKGVPLSIGGGPTFAKGRKLTLNRREDLARVPIDPVSGLTFGAFVPEQTDFAETSLSASSGIGVGFNVGILAKQLLKRGAVSLGARYMEHVRLSYDGDATFTALPGPYRVAKPNVLGLPVGLPLDPGVAQAQAALRNQPASTELVMPRQFVTGISFQPKSALTVRADYQWVDWSAFDTITLQFSQGFPPEEQLVQNYKDTGAGLFGVEYSAGNLRVRGGYFVHSAAAPNESVTPLLPDAWRQHFNGGAGIDLPWKATLDVAYQFIWHADREGRVVNPPAGQLPTAALNSGTYHSRGHLLGLTLSKHIGG